MLVNCKYLKTNKQIDVTFQWKNKKNSKSQMNVF